MYNGFGTSQYDILVDTESVMPTCVTTTDNCQAPGTAAKTAAPTTDSASSDGAGRPTIAYPCFAVLAVGAALLVG